jgi:hypothetical protein
MAYTTINKPNLYFNPVTYTGTGSNQTISVGFTPDFWWIKSRSAATDNRLYNQVASGGYLVSNSTAAQVASGTVAQTAGGFIVGTDGDVNTNGATYVGWNWLASNTTTSNTQGSITSTVSANTTSGFSIVTYTGNGTSGATVGHGLGAVPAFTIVKNRSLGGRNWQGFHQSLGNTKSHLLNSTEVPRTNAVFWNNTSPTSTLITLGNDADVNESGQSFVAYCFAEVKGFSKFGSYTGNGSTDGTFVYTGFKPAWLLIKETSAGDAQWYLYDNKTAPFNLVNANLFPNLTNGTNSGNNQVDFYSNGFKMRSSNGDTNESGGTYIYAAFAENPLVGTNNVPATAR